MCAFVALIQLYIYHIIDLLNSITFKHRFLTRVKRINILREIKHIMQSNVIYQLHYKILKLRDTKLVDTICFKTIQVCSSVIV
jgi:hypothetical protein